MSIEGKCPKCGGEFGESKMAYGCANWPADKGGCKYSVWKTIAERPISAEEANIILGGGTTELLDGFVVQKEGPRRGQNFQAQLKMREDGNGHEMVFPPRD